MKYIMFIGCAVLFTLVGCTKKTYRFTSYFNDGNTLPEQRIKLDNTYRYYIRQLYRSKSSGRNNQKNFLEKEARDSPLEIEYLFVSETHKTVIYISTIPDKFQKYYADTVRYLGENFVNVYDFKKFSFGVLKSNTEFEFASPNGKDKDTWKISHSRVDGTPFITLNTVKQVVNGEFTGLIPVSEALEDDISFKEVVQPYNIIFYRHYKCQRDSAVCPDKNICLHRKGEKFEVFFQFEKDLDGKPKIIYFDNKRIPYNPEPSLAKISAGD